jgi:hypothetical protein
MTMMALTDALPSRDQAIANVAKVPGLMLQTVSQ